MTLVLDSRGEKEQGEKGRPGYGGRKLTLVQAAARLKHPHLVEMRQLFGGAELKFEPELAGGMRLSEICRKRFASGPVPLSFGLRILLDTMSGLAALHGKSFGYSHGEVAPCNIVVGTDGTARIIPVVASHCQDGPPAEQATGYVSPERLRGDAIDHRSDVFSLGVMLWEMITGRSFRGLPSAIITAWVIDGKVPDPVHPDDAAWVVALAQVATRALAVNPADRWETVGVMGAEIEYVAVDHIASSGEVAALLWDADAKKSSPPSKTQSIPSLSPAAISIPPAPIVALSPPPAIEQPSPVIAPTPPDVAKSHPSGFSTPSGVPQRLAAAPAGDAPALASRAPAPTKRPAPRSKQSVVGWLTLGAATVLVGVAAYEVVGGSMASKSVPAVMVTSFTGRPVVSPDPLPVDPPAAAAPPVASAVSTDLRPTAPPPSAEPAPPLTRPAVAAPQVAVPSASPRPTTKPAPVHKPPPHPTNKKNGKVDPTFGI